MIRVVDYAKNGEIDWAGYTKARIEAGEICSRCGFPSNEDETKAGPWECEQCIEITTSAESVKHDKYVRCSSCRLLVAPLNYEIDGFYEEEGDHYVTCPGCGEKFEFYCRILYLFTSERLEKPLEEGPTVATLAERHQSKGSG